MRLKIEALEAEAKSATNKFKESKTKVKELEDSESAARIAIEKAERDSLLLRQENDKLSAIISNVSEENKKSSKDLLALNEKFKVIFDKIDRIQPLNTMKLS